MAMWYSPKGNFTSNSQAINHLSVWENDTFRIFFTKLSGGQWVDIPFTCFESFHFQWRLIIWLKVHHFPFWCAPTSKNENIINSLWPCDAIWCLSTQSTKGNSLFPDGTKPLPEPLLTFHQWSIVTFTWGQFHRKLSRYLSLFNNVMILRIYYIKLQPHFPRAKWNNSIHICQLICRYSDD